MLLTHERVSMSASQSSEVSMVTMHATRRQQPAMRIVVPSAYSLLEFVVDCSRLQRTDRETESWA